MEATLNGSAAVDTVSHTVLDTQSSMSCLYSVLHLFLQQGWRVSRITTTWQICLRARLCIFVTCAGKPAHPIHNCPKQQFPWRPTVIDQIKEFLLCLEFRSAVQLTVGKSCATQSVPSSPLQCASKAAPTDFAPATIAFALTCTGFLLLTCRSTCGLSVCIHQQA